GTILPSLSAKLSVNTIFRRGIISLYLPVDQISFPSADFMQLKYLPPTLKSIMHSGQVYSLGPHHFLQSSGNVHALQTVVIGRSNNLLIVIVFCFPAVATSLLVVMTFDFIYSTLRKSCLNRNNCYTI